jgi:hypothetical protein
MSALTLEIEEIIDQLIVILDRDIRHLEDNIAILDQLRRLVVKQDNAALSQLLESIQSETKNYRENELKRQALRKELAVMFGCSIEQTTLSRIEGHLAQEKRIEIVKRKSKLRTLAGLLKKEYLSTQMLLADCARFNRMLLKNIFEAGRPESITYSPRGAAQRQADMVFMNLQF